MKEDDENCSASENIGCYGFLIVVAICLTILKLNGAI